MKKVFQIQKDFNIFALGVLIAFLGVTVSCDDSDDTESTSSGGGSKSITFSGGADSEASIATEGIAVQTTAGAGSVGSAVSAADDNGTVEADKLPNNFHSTGSPTSKICSYTIEGTSLPTITLHDTEVEIATADDGTSGVAAKLFVEALGASATKTFQGYEFAVTQEGGENDTGQLQVKVTPALNVASYSAKFKMHASDCSASGGHVTLTMGPLGATISGDAAGKPAVAYKIFGKSKAERNTDKEEKDSITIDGFKIELSDIPLIPSKLVDALKARINGTAFRASDKVKVYLAGPYIASKGTTGEQCGLGEGKRLSSGAVCLVLTRLMWGEAGNGKVPYEESYTKVAK